MSAPTFRLLLSASAVCLLLSAYCCLPLLSAFAYCLLPLPTVFCLAARFPTDQDQYAVVRKQDVNGAFLRGLGFALVWSIRTV
jgi:hypothetical protein